MRAWALVLLATAALVACGGSSASDRAKDSFGVYREAETRRDGAEADLGRAFREISRAADARDRAGVLAAVGRGEDAVETIYAALEVQLDVADALAAYEPTQANGRRLRDALRGVRAGARLVDQELDIASRDPFLDLPANAREISRLSSESVRVGVPAAFARRRAVRGIAETLGVEPPLDVMFDLPQTNPG